MAALLSFGLTVVLTPVVIAALRRRGVLDVPNERSSHAQPTPRGGGAAAAVGMAAGLLAATSVGGRGRAALVAGVCLFALLGLAEDLVGVPVLWRFLSQLAAAGAVCLWLLGDVDRSLLVRVVLVAVAAVFVAGYVNAFNFMDGINGISAAQAAAAGGVWFVIGRAENVDGFATAAAVVALAAVAFAPYNFPRARVFLGDVGSYAFGGALGALALFGVRRGLPAEAVLAPLALYLADTGTTLARRFLRGEPWYRPHRDHVYQQLVVLGWSHVATTSAVGATTLVLGALGTVSLGGHAGYRAVADVAIVAVLAAYLAAPALLRRRRAGAAPAWA